MSAWNKAMGCVDCRWCGSDKVGGTESRKRNIGGVMTMVRTKKCAVCGESYKTAELPLNVAKEVLTQE